jgi:hypothetical protein
MMMSKYKTPNIVTLIATSSDSSSASMGKSRPPVSLSLECGRRNEHTVKVDDFDRSNPLSPECEEGMNTETSLESQYGFHMKDKPSAQEDSEDEDSGMDVPPSPNQDDIGVDDDLSSESQQSPGTDCVGTPCCAAHGAARRLQKTHLWYKVLLVLSAVYRARVNTSDILLGRVGLFSPLLI